MGRLADPLRDYAASTELAPGMSIGRCRDDMLAIADAIDAEHGRRMEQSRRETKRAFARYLRSVIRDYTVSRKWVRKGDGNG